MPIPSHLQADLHDGMDPNEVLAVECQKCGEYLGQLGEWADDDAPWADEELCYRCWNSAEPKREVGT